MPKTSAKKRLIALILLISLTGCMTRPEPAPVSNTPAVGTPAEAAVIATSPRPELDLAAHISRVRQMNALQLQIELGANRLRAREFPSYENRLRLALTLWAAGGEDQEIQQLAESSQADPRDDQLRGIGLLLTSIIAERRRNKDLVANSQTRSRESRREQEAQQAKLDALKRQIDDLERKLAAMRDMEKSMQRRP